MSRFLTPAKIALLVLIELYIYDSVPSAAILPILSFITSQITDYQSASFPSHISTPSSLPTAAAPRVSTSGHTRSVSSQHQQPQSPRHTPSRFAKAETAVSLIVDVKVFERLLTPHPNATGIPGRKLYDTFLERLWAINSLDGLHRFFAHLCDLTWKSKEDLRQSEELGLADVVVGIVSKNSPFGQFTRRSHLEFERLKFHDATALWGEFVKYRQHTAPHRRRRDPAFCRLSFDHALMTGEEEGWDQAGVDGLTMVAYGDLAGGGKGGGNGGRWPVSFDDIEGLLEFQIEQMQSEFAGSLGRPENQAR